MNQYISILISSLVGLIFGFIGYQLQFRSANNFATKNRNKFLYHLLTETETSIKVYAHSVLSYAEAIPKSKYTVELFYNIPNSHMQILEQILLKDDYYNSYMKMFGNYLEAEEMYKLGLRAVINFNTLFPSAPESIKDVVKYNQERVESGVTLYNEITTHLIEICTHPDNKDVQIFKDLLKIYSDFLSIGKSSGHFFDKLLEHFLTPIRDLSGNSSDNQKIFSLITQNRNLNKIIAECRITQQNHEKQFCNNLIPVFQNVILDYKKVLDFWKTTLSKELY